MSVFTIYYGANTPMRAVGNRQCRLLAFAERNRGWHSVPDHISDKTALARLKAKGYIEMSASGLWRFQYPKGVV
jgi:hypothetical protein